MIAHTQTIFASVAWVAMIMAACLLLVGQRNSRDGLLLAGCGLFSHALAYICYTTFGQTPLWLSYVAGNSLLSLALAFYTASIFRINGRNIPWRLVFLPPLLDVILLSILIDTVEPRILSATLMLSTQCILLIRYARSNAAPGGRSVMLLIGGAGISLIGLAIRVVAVISGTAADMQYDNNNLKQTISVGIGTITVIMLSLGLILMYQERIETRLKFLALHDALTGVPNRRAILEQLDKEIRRAQRSHSAFAVAILDIDHFKRINDTYGHQGGDNALCHCVAIMLRRLRKSDQIGRYGGEEFLLVLPDTTPEGAAKTIEELRKGIAGNPTLHEGEFIAHTVSSGFWCGVPEADDTIERIIAQADAALYRAKHSGRNRVCSASDINGNNASTTGPAE